MVGKSSGKANRKSIYFEHPHPKAVIAVFPGGLGARTLHCGVTIGWGTALLLGAARILCGWALQGCSAVGHCRDAWWSGTAGMLRDWALQSGSGWRARTT